MFNLKNIKISREISFSKDFEWFFCKSNVSSAFENKTDGPLKVKGLFEGMVLYDFYQILKKLNKSNFWIINEYFPLLVRNYWLSMGLHSFNKNAFKIVQSLFTPFWAEHLYFLCIYQFNSYVYILGTGISRKKKFQMFLYLSFHNYKIVFKVRISSPLQT